MLRERPLCVALKLECNPLQPIAPPPHQQNSWDHCEKGFDEQVGNPYNKKWKVLMASLK